MTPFTRIDAIAAPLDMSNVDTECLIPARFLRKARDQGLQRYLFHDLRFAADGSELADFVLNRAPYRDAAVLVAGRNFGCGSSREAAVYVLMDYGIRAVIAPSFGDIFFGNLLQNGMLPAVLPDDACADLRRELEQQPGAHLRVDLEAQTVVAPSGATHPFAIDADARQRLLKGLDDIELVLQHLPEIEAFEARYHAELPWRS